jgi:hypothetical protein
VPCALRFDQVAEEVDGVQSKGGCILLPIPLPTSSRSEWNSCAKTMASEFAGIQFLVNLQRARVYWFAHLANLRNSCADHRETFERRKRSCGTAGGVVTSDEEGGV